MFSLDDIQQMTEEYGEGWGLPHVNRVLKLIALIRAEVPHDADVLTWATYLHDWGAFPHYVQAGVPHALRSAQIAEQEILPETHFTDAQKKILLEAIEKHDYQDQRPVVSSEALLLREADWLDMLGTIGLAREFAWGPNNLRLCYNRIIKHRDAVQHRFTLPIAQPIAAQRIDAMNTILNQILDEGFDIL
jgi:uncharacterized protein